MAGSDDQASSGVYTPWDALRRVQEIGAQLVGAAQSMTADLSGSPVAQYTEPMARLGERAVELSTLWVAPMRAILEEQQELMDAVASWADEQRKLADRFGELARRHRELTDQVSATLSPALDHLDRLSGRKPAKKAATKKKSST